MRLNMNGFKPTRLSTNKEQLLFAQCYVAGMTYNEV